MEHLPVGSWDATKLRPSSPFVMTIDYVIKERCSLAGLGKGPKHRGQRVGESRYPERDQWSPANAQDCQ